MSEAGQNAHVVSLRNQIDHKRYQETPKSAGCFGGMVMEYCIEKTEDAQNYSDNLGMLMRILDPSPQILFHTLHCFKRTGINTKPPKLQYRKRTGLRVLGCLFATNTRSAAQRQRIQTRVSIFLLDEGQGSTLHLNVTYSQSLFDTSAYFSQTGVVGNETERQ